MSFSARGCVMGMSRQEIEQRFAEMEAQIEEFRETVNNAEFWIQKLELNPELVALRKSIQEKDREIAELKKTIGNTSFWFQRLELDPEITKLKNDIKDLQKFKSKFMEFDKRFDCSRFNSFWSWG